jgi:ferredoxin
MARTRFMCPAMSVTGRNFADGDWALVTSPSGEIRVQVRRMDAVNGSTLWTWNAIGKRAGAWALGKDAPETTRGFLLNHLIDELLPPKGDGRRWANSDPITGQAAWFDLRVRSAAIRTSPAFTASRMVRRGARWGPVPTRWPSGGRLPNDLTSSNNRKTPRTGDRSRHLRRLPCLRGQLQGMEHRRGRFTAGDVDAYGADPSGPGSTASIPSKSHLRDAPAQIVHFPKSCLHCDDAPCVTVCPTGASHKRAEDGIVLVTEDMCIGCGCAPGPVPTARARWIRSKT